MKTVKTLLLALCAVALVVTTVLGTLAYLADQKALLNTFTMGQVHIKLDEAKVDEFGQLDGTRTETGNTYHLIPGQPCAKDPTVTVTKESEEAYVRIIVTITAYSQLKTVFGGSFLPENFVSGWDRNVWPCVAITENTADNSASYEFRYADPTSGEDTVTPDGTNDLVLAPLFTTLQVPTGLTNESLESLGNAGFAIYVSAYAIQAAGFADADAAWTAYQNNNP